MSLEEHPRQLQKRTFGQRLISGTCAYATVVLGSMIIAIIVELIRSGSDLGSTLTTISLIIFIWKFRGDSLVIEIAKFPVPDEDNLGPGQLLRLRLVTLLRSIKETALTLLKFFLS